MLIMTANGYTDFRPIQHARAAPACIALMRDHVRHSNAWRKEFNAGRANAKTDQMRNAPEWSLLKLPDWAK